MRRRKPIASIAKGSGTESPRRGGNAHRRGDDAPDLLRRLDKVRIGKVGVARRGSVSPVPKQLFNQRQILTGFGPGRPDYSSSSP